MWPFRSSAQAWRIGISWTAATIAFEFLFGHFALGNSWSRLFPEHETRSGRLWSVVLAALLLLPALAACLGSAFAVWAACAGGPLTAGGPAELARTYGVEAEGAFADECHYCYVVRKSLVARFPEFLAPPQEYGLQPEPRRSAQAGACNVGCGHPLV